MADSFPSRRSYAALAIAFIGFAIYASLIPFNTRPLAFDEAVARFQAAMTAWPGRASRSDVLANIMLFAPVGFTLAGALLVDRSNRWRNTVGMAAAVFAVSLAASTGAEFIQTFTRDRLPARIDIVSQTFGCGIGILAWVIAGPAVTAWVRDTLSSHHDRLPRVLATYVVAWMFVHLAPFDFSLDVGVLADRFRSGRIAVLPDEISTRVAWDAVAEILAAIPIGAAAVIAWPFHPSPSRLETLALGVGVPIAIESAQVFIRSHSALASDALLQACGVFVGVWVAPALLRRQVAPTAPERGALSARAVGALLLWSVVLALYHWQPFEFTVNSQEIRAKLARLSMIPFKGYAGGSSLNALMDILTKTSLAGPVGLVAAFVLPRRTKGSLTAIVSWTFLFVALFGVIELGQFFVRSRIPDPSDVYIGTLGALAGLLTGYWLSPGRAR